MDMKPVLKYGYVNKFLLEQKILMFCTHIMYHICDLFNECNQFQRNHKI